MRQTDQHRAPNDNAGRLTSNGLDAFRRCRGRFRGGCGVLFELLLHLLFLLALLFQFLLAFLVPEIGFCQVVFSLSGYPCSPMDRWAPRTDTSVGSVGQPLVNNTPSAMLPTKIMRLARRVLP